MCLVNDAYVSRWQAKFFYEHEMWFLSDLSTTNGTWVNGVRIEPGKKYQLITNDEIRFSASEKIIFYKHEKNAQPVDNDDTGKITFLETAMKIFAESQYKDDAALKSVIISLCNVPLYFHAEIDLEAMLGNIDPEKLKPGDTLQTSKDVKVRILTGNLENGEVFVPVYTSEEEAGKVSKASCIRYYPEDYLPMLVQMGKLVIINSASESRFFLTRDIIQDVFMPLVLNKTSTSTSKKSSDGTDKYVGTVVGGRYSVLQMIGRGGFCTTYLVRDRKSNHIWAMKACDKTDKHYCPAIRENILHEVNMMIAIKHPAIPQVVDIVEDEEGLFIIREYVEGVTLESVVRDFGAVRAEVVAEWGKDLCDMLGYLHKMTPPRIYRDMKPANIILTPDHVLKVIDFGIVRVYDSMKKGDTCFLGTKGYAAPEQYGVRQSDARTDIYGLGMTMHHLVTGIDPKKSLCEAFPIRQYNAALPKGLEYIISKCIQSNPDDRYQSCDELLTDLNNYMKLPKPKGIIGKLFNR